MNYQKGFNRLVWVVSISAWFITFVKCDFTDEPEPAFGWGFLAFCVVWILYFGIAWIIRGFNEREKETKK